MRRFIIDTNLYIDWLNAGKHESIIFQPDAVKFMSTVVMMELLAGAYSVHDRTRPSLNWAESSLRLRRPTKKPALRVITNPRSGPTELGRSACDHR